MLQCLHRAVIPLGGVRVAVGLGKAFITPLVTLNVKPEMFVDPWFDVKRNWPVLFTVGCNAIDTGFVPVGKYGLGLSAVNVPAPVLIVNP